MTSDYQFWLTFDSEKEKILLPVNPEKINIKHGSNNESVKITGLGDITIIQSRKAAEISFSSFFPLSPFMGIKVSAVTPPLELIKKINEWRESDKPIHFIVTQCAIDMFCTAENFSYSEKGGDIGSYEYSITLKEYREITMRQVNVDTSSQKATVEQTEQRVDNTVKPKTYTVKSGDCLYNIAKRLYGNGSEYRKIYEANKSIIGGNPNLIYPGQVFTIPG